MVDRVTVGGLEVAAELHAFVRDDALPASGVEEAAFWAGVEAILGDFAPRNRELLARREELQQALDDWHSAHPGPVADQEAYVAMLRELGYLVEEPADFTIDTANVDAEVAVVAGPQLVVPVLNARFAANAANARWGSLYDALYGTDVIPESEGLEKGSSYNPARGAAVIAFARGFLDEHFPLAVGSHAEVTAYTVVEGAQGSELSPALADPGQLVGWRGDPEAPEGVLLVHHGLHVEIQVDHADAIGKDDAAGVKDLLLEAAVTTIMDLEDSVAAVDAADKVAGYRNWLQLNQGSLSAEVSKGGTSFTRGLAEDRLYDGPAGQIVLPGRSLLFVRQVGHLMTTDAVLWNGEEIPEGVLDAIVTALCSLVDLQGRSTLSNSRTGSMYAVKPKMHGPEEVAFTDDLFAAVEDLLGLARGTIKLGIMDEERRTSANLKACIHAARGRVAFINTGFLDRTGDELHTSMRGGPMVRKAEMKSTEWIAAYEDQNVDIGLACGLGGRAQIGKGMWAMPDEMAAMVEQKIGHPRAGASCAWVPSPTAATLHALHYHQVDVAARQRELAGGRRTTIEQLLTVPLADPAQVSGWTEQDKTAEIENNLQGILGYVKRWIDEGIGCSKVPDIHGTALMEDRATCRISSQHVANWLHHGVVTADEVEAAFRRMADVVDQQQGTDSASDGGYELMGPGYDGEAFAAAHDLVYEGLTQPSGYTEPILHRRRRALKERRAAAR
ncbi:MAG TPA: malate synthase G [Nocardioides sp.]|uniref:malate synthase G n=1 Tax=uncultured Nocardioides sp. TaxID=198441 RepID=UPI00263121F1|nr:malate synthase G [uncultured Nocardioides sp.]HRD60235.1 malate synthase G [Nocardioides sp.]HRI96446.1 malate synthase G [Nocardioides sp.]HRK47037.1 malate synthase G [Nocardioides sp.]